MKKLLKSLVLFAAAAMALTSCENEGLNEGITENNTFTLSFTADVPQTRTSVAIDGNAANFAWSVDAEGNLTDRVIFLQTQDANDKVNTKYSDAEESSIEEGVATFVTDFAAVENATLYNYCAIYPETATSNPTSLESVKVTLPASQNITEGSYDPKADLMMSKLITEVEAKNGHGGNLEFTRLAAIGKMVLKGVTADEEIQSVKLTFTDKVLNGDVTLDFINGTATYAAEGNDNVEVKGAMVAEASNDIFFTCFPGTYSGAYRVDVTTDVATYYKEGNLTKDLVFSAGDVTIFGATVSNRQASNIKTYTKVTKTNLADYSGNYLLVYEAGNVAFDGSRTTFDATNNKFAVEISDNAITGAHGDKAFTIAKIDGGYSVQSASGYYIGQTSFANDVVESEETVYVNTITINEDGTADVACTTTGGQVIIMYNNTSGQDRFRYYKEGSSQQAIALYRENGTGSDEELVKALESIEVSGQTTTFTVDDEWVFGGTVTAKYNDGTTADVTASADVDNSEVQLDTAGEYTVNVSYTEDEVTKEFSYTVTVSNAPVAGEEKTYTVDNFNTELNFGGNTGNVTDGKAYSLGSDLTLTGHKGSNNLAPGVNKDGSIRLYTNNSLVIASEKTIVKIEFTFTGASYTGTIDATPDTYSDGTWTGSANSVTFTNTASGQARIKTMTITYLGAGGEGGETPEPTPEIEISVENQNIAKTEVDGTVPVTVTNGDGYEFEATIPEEVDWLEVQWVDGGVYYVAGANIGAERTATVEIFATDGENEKTVTFTITQAAGESTGGEGVVVLSEEFDNTNTKLDGDAISSSTFSNFSGNYNKAYKGCGGIKLGTSNAIGFITSKALDLSSAFTVKLDAGRYKSNATEITVTVGNQTKTISNTQLKDGTSTSFNYTTFELEFEAASANATVVISTTSNGKRAGIDNVIITKN